MKTLFASAIALIICAPALADNCSGEFDTHGTGGSPVDVSGRQAMAFTAYSLVTSGDTPYNGEGPCSGYSYERDGKTYISDICIRTTKDGDTWTVLDTYVSGDKRGYWQALSGTGKFAKNAGSTGWWEVTSGDDKGSKGKWGGNCLGVK